MQENVSIGLGVKGKMFMIQSLNPMGTVGPTRFGVDTRLKEDADENPKGGNDDEEMYKGGLPF